MNFQLAFSTSICVIIFCTTYGQIEKPIQKGNFTAGGEINYSYTKSEISKQNNLGFSPNFGYFVAKGLNIGIQADLSFYSNKYDPDYPYFQGENKGTSFLLSPYIRYYTNSGFFGHLQGGLGNSKNSNNFGESNTSVSLWSAGLGYAYFLNQNIAIEPLLFYRTTYYDGGGEVNQIALSIGLKAFF